MNKKFCLILLSSISLIALGMEPRKPASTPATPTGKNPRLALTVPGSPKNFTYNLWGGWGDWKS